MWWRYLTVKHVNKINTDKFVKTLANFVPAAAVKREGLALFGLIWRKGYVGWKLINKKNVKFTFNLSLLKSFSRV